MTIPLFYLDQLLIRFVKCFEVREEEMIVIIVNPEEGENGSIVGGIKVTVRVNVGDDDAGQLIDDDEYDD